MSDELMGRVCATVAKTQHIPVERVTADSTFEELGMDSMDAVNLLFELENEFDISIPDGDARAIRTVRQMAEGLEKLLEAKAAGSGQ
jgi:acyl carrier protein